MAFLSITKESKPRIDSPELAVDTIELAVKVPPEAKVKPSKVTFSPVIWSLPPLATFTEPLTVAPVAIAAPVASLPVVKPIKASFEALNTPPEAISM